MDDAIRTTALNVRASMPCSIELPAGTGKTHLLGALVAVAAERGERTLILTHTNAGVDVLRRRLRQFSVDEAAARVDTIAGWSFDLIQHYPLLSGLAVGIDPDWSRSREYYLAAAAVLGATALRHVLGASYGLVAVDEYQDCVIEQHELILALSESLPVCVFGDPLQNIFNFGDNVTVSWNTNVVGTWPALKLPIHPWRWNYHNTELGAWLIDIRKSLYAGKSIDLVGAPLKWYVDRSQQTSIQACYSQRTGSGSVVAIGRWANDCAFVAARTNGSYGMMEELEGRFMMSFAAVVDSKDGRQIASETLRFAKSCISGTAKVFDSAVVTKLREGKSVTHLTRRGAERQLNLLTSLLADSSPARVQETLQSIAQLANTHMYRREAWTEMLKALNIVASGSDLSVSQALIRVRNRTRIIGRAREERIISRTAAHQGS